MAHSIVALILYLFSYQGLKTLGAPENSAKLKNKYQSLGRLRWQIYLHIPLRLALLFTVAHIFI